MLRQRGGKDKIDSGLIKNIVLFGIKMVEK
jgi:hypothetical protein